jgi:hypothetical protein
MKLKTTNQEPTEYYIYAKDMTPHILSIDRQY